MMSHAQYTRSESAIEGDQYLAIAEQSVNVLMLPDSQQALLNWLDQRGAVSVAEIAAHLNQDKAATLTLLQTLEGQGFVQKVAVTRQLPAFSTSRQSMQVQPMLQESALSHPLAVIVSPSGDYSAVAGSTFELSVTVFNRGGRGAIIQVFVDETDQILQQWCDTPSKQLALGSGESSEVLFCFKIPIQSLPSTYTYLLVVDVPEHYPEYARHVFQKRLQILPPVESVVRINDPTFTLQPATSSAQPIVLQSRATLEVKVLVHNRSNRVDRFRLSCPDIPTSWFTVRYPQGLQTPGLEIATDGLNLNPNTKGEILLYLTPPPDVIAGIYTPTIRLHSTNNPELNLLDVVYLEVAPVHLMTAELQTLIGQIQRQPALYQIHVLNSGNSKRNLLLHVHSSNEEDDRFYTYTWLNSSASSLTTSSTPSFDLSIPSKESVRTGLQIQPTRWWHRPWFGRGRVLNFTVTLEDTQKLPISSEPLRGVLIWQARPWWQVLLLVLFSVGAIALLAFLVWWFFFRPFAPAKILQFAAEESVYREENETPIRLSWQVSNPNRIESLKITGYAQNNSAILSQPIVYDFSRGIPQSLTPFCAIANALLTCRNIPTDARKAGDYIFELQAALPKRTTQTAPSISQKSDLVRIMPIAQPKIVRYSSTVLPNVRLTNAARAFLGQESAPNQDLLSDTQPLFLHTWKILNPRQIRSLELVGRDPDGSVISPQKRYDFSQGIPSQLQSFCTLAKDLMCRDVPTLISKSGDYIFELAVIARQGEGEPSHTKKTDTLKIASRPPRILNFQVNGRTAIPKYLIPIDPKNRIKEWVVSWSVEPGKDVKVELLPTPGTVPLQGIVRYPLLQQPGTTTITLQVTTAGQQIRRAIEVQVFDPKPTATIQPPKPSPPVSASPSPSSSPSPTPTPTPIPSPTPTPSASPSQPPTEPVPSTQPK